VSDFLEAHVVLIPSEVGGRGDANVGRILIRPRFSYRDATSSTFGTRSAIEIMERKSCR
jgi:hypothetical protein